MQSVSGLNVLVTGAAMGLGKLFATRANVGTIHVLFNNAGIVRGNG